MKSLQICVLTGIASVFVSVPLSAQWAGGIKSGNYADTANWQGGVINGVFEGDLPSYAGQNSYEVLFQGESYLFSTGLTFNFTTPAGKISLIRDGVAPVGLTLGGDIFMNAGNGQQATVSLGSASRSANIDLGGVDRTFSVAGPLWNWSNQNVLSVFGSISNGGIIKLGNGRLELIGANNYTGKTLIGGGRVTVKSSGSISASSGVTVSGLNTQLILEASNSGTARIAQSVPVTLAGGMLHFDASTANAKAETLGTVTLSAGRSALGVGRVKDNNNTGSLTLDSLVRTNYATLNLQSYTPSTGGVIKLVNDANITADLVGGAGANGTTTKSIVPWLTMGTYNTNTTDSTGYSSTAGLVTYDAVNKTFRALDQATEYRVDDIANSGSTENNRLTSTTTLSQDKTVNSIYASAANTLTIDAGKVLTVTSGAIAMGGNAFNIFGGVLDFGSRTGIVTGRSTSTISSEIRGTAGFIAANVGNGLTLSGANTYTGPTVVQGNLFTSGNERIANSSHLQVDIDGTFGVGNGNTETLASLSGRGTVRLENTAARLIFGTSGGTVGAVTFGAGSFVSPGDGTGEFIADALKIGASNKATNVVFEAGSSFNVSIGGLSSFDSLQVINGNVLITGGNLAVSIIGSFVAADGDSFKVITASGTGAGSFTNLSEGWTGAWVGKDYILTYSAIPEPQAFAILLGGVILTAAVARRRRG